MAGGRPTDYRVEFCEQIIEMGKLGYSQTEMASEIGVSKQTFYSWRDTYKEFLDAIQLARTHSQCWWERKGREDLNADKFHSAVYNKRIAGMFPDDYMDKSKQEHIVSPRVVRDNIPDDAK